MDHPWLLAAVSASYLGTLLVHRRLRALWGRLHGLPPERLRQLHGAVLSGQVGLAEAVQALAEAEREARGLPRYRLAARARRLAATGLAEAKGPEPAYLWLQATLGYLTDQLNLELSLWRSGRLLRRALALHGQAPLLHLSAALRASVAGETAECLQALARALYHSQGDPFVAQLILGLPGIEELAPSLAAEAGKIAQAKA